MKKVLKATAVVAGIAAVAGIAYGVYRYFTDDFGCDCCDDYDDDYDDDDDFEDDFFDDYDEPEKKAEEPVDSATHIKVE